MGSWTLAEDSRYSLGGEVCWRNLTTVVQTARAFCCSVMPSRMKDFFHASSEEMSSTLSERTLMCETTAGEALVGSAAREVVTAEARIRAAAASAMRVFMMKSPESELTRRGVIEACTVSVGSARKQASPLERRLAWTLAHWPAPSQT